MPTDVTLPELGENITRATVLDVLVSKGDTVDKDQPVLSLESDKAEFDLPSPAAGTVADVLVKRGDEIEVGQVILRLEDGASARADAESQPAATPQPRQDSEDDAVQAKERTPPEGGARGGGADRAPARDERDERDEAPDQRDERDEDAPAAREEPRTRGGAEASVSQRDTRARSARRVRPQADSDDGGLEQRMPSYEEAAGAPHLADDDVKPDARGPQPARPPARERAARGDGEGKGGRARALDGDDARAPAQGEAAREGGEAPARALVAAAPSVRRLARELGVEIAEVTGTSTEGRISAEDVYRHVRRKLAALETSARPAEKDRDYSRWGETRVEPMTTVRRRTAEQMSLAWSTIPHVTHHDIADITELDRLRRQFAPRVEKAGGKLTITAVLLKVVGSALRRYPKFNASVDMENAAVVYKEFVNVGVAVDTERGLLVPVIRRVDEKNIVELALELKEISEAARARKIRPETLQGATFTVTNLGGIGGSHFGPLINPPEVAVLGASRSEMRQTWVDGRFEPRLILPLSVSYDHRVIDGADAARFLRWVCEAMGEPFLMDLEGD